MIGESMLLNINLKFTKIRLNLKERDILIFVRQMGKAATIFDLICVHWDTMSMFFVFVYSKSLPPCCLIATSVTEILYSFMNRFFVVLKITLITCLIITVLTRIFFSFMNRFFVSPKIAMISCLIITLATKIFNTLVHRFFVGLKITLLCSLIMTLVTGILYTFV